MMIRSIDAVKVNVGQVNVGFEQTSRPSPVTQPPRFQLVGVRSKKFSSALPLKP
jgi:hypothetical protein